MAISSLRYDAKADVDETRQGIQIYSGESSRYHEWEFRTMLEIDSSNGEEKRRKEITSQVVKALRGDAYRIAMDIGREALMAEDGVPKLVAALLLNAFPQQKSEAKRFIPCRTRPNGTSDSTTRREYPLLRVEATQMVGQGDSHGRHNQTFDRNPRRANA